MKKRATDIRLVKGIKLKKKMGDATDKTYLVAFLHIPKDKSAVAPIAIDYRPELEERKKGVAAQYAATAEIFASPYSGTEDDKEKIQKLFWWMPFSRCVDSSRTKSALGSVRMGKKSMGKYVDVEISIEFPGANE